MYYTHVTVAVRHLQSKYPTASIIQLTEIVFNKLRIQNERAKKQRKESRRRCEEWKRQFASEVDVRDLRESAA